MFQLFDDSNFDAYDRGRYPAVLEAGLAEHGLATTDVLAVAQDLSLWAICTTGLFRADLRGILKKRVEVGELIPVSRMGQVKEEPSGPHTMKIVVLDAAGKKLAKIDFGAGGPDRTIEGAAAHCRRVRQIMVQSWA